MDSKPKPDLLIAALRIVTDQDVYFVFQQNEELPPNV